MEDVTKSKCYIRLKLAYKVSMVLNVVIVMALICLYLTRQFYDRNLQDTTLLQQSHVDTIPDTICLSCSYFGEAIQTEENVLYDNIFKTQGGHLCCFHDEHGIQDMFLKMLNEENMNESSSSSDEGVTRRMQWWRNRDFSAHLYRESTNIPGSDMTWTSKDFLGTGFIRNLTLSEKSKIQLDDGLGAGMYFIYSLITVTSNNPSRRLPEGAHIINKSNKEVLNNIPSSLAFRRFGGNNNEKNDSYTSFLCLTEYLNIGDEIETKLTIKNVSNYGNGGMFSNYFGMFKL
ncbi:uncharacterized protein LOC117342223 isoform X2 [Pecten maximus]|uniref:uncharacterized protein LOC117342223 isoform X2 n=1 Tax=Pecten maximus TaxID=6579 RepID=UPI0014582BF6|nr:uncharacterized protein LOC117342223 isoform X2 [Pecten maximus]